MNRFLTAANFLQKALFATLFLTPLAYAANIIQGTAFKDSPAIVLTGPIAPGDFEKFKVEAKRLLRNHHPVFMVLDSSGGDFIEAIKIGELIRQLNAQTVVSGKIYKDSSTQISRCYSACFLIHAAGSVRHYTQNNVLFDKTGDSILQETPVIGIHRPYVNPELNKRLSPNDARQLYDKIESATRRYMDSVGVSKELVDEMFRTPSNNIVLISQEQYQARVGQQQAYFQEWLISKCGTLDSQEYADLGRVEAMRISSGNVEALPKSISPGYGKYLASKQAEVGKCRETSVISHQRRQLDIQ